MTPPWTLVAHVADHSSPTLTVERLAGFLAREAGAEVTTVGWTSGPRPLGSHPGPHLDVGAVRRLLLPLRLERVGLRTVGGGLRGRAVRRRLSGVPDHGVVYLSTGFSGAVLRYLPPGRRTVVTHVHPADVRGAAHLPGVDRDRLVEATDRWLAADADVARWMVEEWALDPAAIELVPACVDGPPPDPDRDDAGSGDGGLVVAVAGSSGWATGTDHTARLARALRARRPALPITFRWIGLHDDERELWPIRHDLGGLGMGDSLEAALAPADPRAGLDGVEALVLTAHDDPCPWQAWEAAARGIPVVCFDTHRISGGTSTAVGGHVPYPDLGRMADAVLALHDDPTRRRREGAAARARVRAERGVEVVGPLVLAAGAGAP